MAFVEKRGTWYRLAFRHEGKRYTHTLKTKKIDVAEGILGGVQRTLMLLKHHVLRVPQGADVKAFVLNGGQVQNASPATSEVPDTTTVAAVPQVTLDQL